MKLYIKGAYSKHISYGYLELAGKMWFPEEEQLSYSNSGNNDALQKNFSVSLMLRKDNVDERWNDVPLKEGVKHRFNSHTDETLYLDFEKSYATDYREKGDCLRILSTHLNLLTVDKKAMYIMAIEVAAALDGQISEDDKVTWLTVEEFKEKHRDILALTFDEANELSLKEIATMDAIKDPLWEEEDKRHEEYIKIHGERVWDDEDEGY